jgi:hypothetical protein
MIGKILLELECCLGAREIHLLDHHLQEVRMKLKNFLSFERMITPVIIKVVFYIGLVGSAIGWIVFFFTMLIAGFQGGGFGAILGRFLIGLIGGLLIVFLGALVTRIYAETLILVFRINETLTDIKQYLKEREEL